MDRVIATVDGKPAELFDSAGRLVVTPHALTLEGQTNVQADLRPGESLDSFLARHIDGVHSGAWAVYIGGLQVPQKMWPHFYPKDGTVIAARCVVKKQVLAIVAVAVLAYFTMGAGAAAGAGILGTSVGAGMGVAAVAVANAAIFIGGSMLINRVLAPKMASLATNDKADPVYALGAASNAVRKYEPIPMILGEVRFKPDYASLPYSWYESNDQMLAMIFHAGVNAHSYTEIRNGDTPLANYEDVSIYNAGFGGMPDDGMPLYTNPDSIDGAELQVPEGSAGRDPAKWRVFGDWVTRTTSADTVQVQIDIEGQLYDVGTKGEIGKNAVELQVEYSPVGAGQWRELGTERLSHDKTSPMRRTLSYGVPKGQHEVRVRSSCAMWADDADQHKIQWTQLKSIQADDANYEGLARIGVKIKATGQLNGALNQVSILARQEPIPVWDGAKWINATTPAEGLSNPGALMLYLERGVYRQGRLVAGLGLPDEMIDIESYKAFMLHCKARNFTFNAAISDTRSIGDLLDTVALAGMGQRVRKGGKYGVSWVWKDQALGGVANMATMKASSFGVAYNFAEAADGIEYTYFDAEASDTRTIRVAKPGVTTVINPSRITGEGITTAAHAAILARYHLAQSLYQYKDISFDTDLEHLDYQRLSVLGISHDLTKWGAGGRLTGAQIINGVVHLTLDEPVLPHAAAYVGLRLLGESVYRVFAVEPLTESSNQLTLSAAWPADLPFPSVGTDNPAHDTLWFYDFRSTPGYKVRVVSVTPDSDFTGASVAVVPESPEFWDYVINGVYVPVGEHGYSNPAVTGQPPVASNLKVTEQRFVEQGLSELTITFDAAPNYDNAEIWATPFESGLEPVLVARTNSTQATWRVTTAGAWQIQVRPFSSTLPGPVATLLYTTTTVAAPPWNYDSFVVQEIAGGLRRYAFGYSDGNSPIDISGAEIRYIAGFVDAPAWDSMTPLGDDGFYTASFEGVNPPAGEWTFALRARNWGGILAVKPVLFQAALGDNFAQVQVVDLTPPPDVTGLSAVGGFGSVQVSWDPAIYKMGHGHGRTIIYGSTKPDAVFADAVQVAEAFNGPVSFSSDPATTWQLWAKHQTVDGTLSVSPGEMVSVATGQDPSKLKEALDGQIDKSWLNSALNAEIDLISGDAVGSVNDRLAQEAQERAAALQAEAQARAQAVQNMGDALQESVDAVQLQAEASAQALSGSIDAVDSRLTDAAQGLSNAIDTVQAQVADIVGAAEYDPGAVYLAGSLVKRNDKLYRAIQDVAAGTPPPNNVYWELIGDYASLGAAVAAHTIQLSDHENRITETASGLTAEASARDALAAQLRGKYAGTDVSKVTSGLVFNERQARVAGDSANASLIQGVRSDLTGAQGAIAGQGEAIGKLETSVTEIDGKVTAEAQRLDSVKATVDSNTSAITRNERAIADAASSSAESTSMIEAKLRRDNEWGRVADVLNGWDSRAAIIESRRVIADEKVAQADVNEQLKAQIAGNAAALQTEARVRADADAAETAARQALSAVVDGKASGTAVESLSQRVDAADGKIASQGQSITSLSNSLTETTKTATDAAAAAEKAQATANTKADASALNALDSKVTQQGETITSQGSSITSLNSSLATTNTNVGKAQKSADDAAAAAAVAQATASTKADASALQSLDSKVTQQGNVITAEAQRLDSVKATVDSNTSAITRNERAIADAASSSAESTSMIEAKLRRDNEWGRVADVLNGWDSRAAIIESRRVIADEKVAQADVNEQLKAQIAGNAAALQEERLVRADADDALARATQQLSVRVESNAAALQTESSVRASADGHIGAQWTMRMALSQDGRQVVAGAGMTGTSSADAGPQFDFGVMANTFWIAAPAGSTGVASVRPFVVQTTPTTANGVTVPAGVYMDAAYITNLTVLYARFGTLVTDSVQAAAISASQLTLGDGTVGGVLKSSSYKGGELGWRLTPQGAAEFNDVTVRGTVYASAGTIGGFVIAADSLSSSNYVSGSRGVRLTSAGDAELRNWDNSRVFHLGATGSAPVLRTPGFELLANGVNRMTAGVIQSKDGRIKIDLDARGNVRSIDFNGELTYSESEGLRINKLNVIDTLQLKEGSISDALNINTGESTIWRNTNWNRVGQFPLPAGTTGLLSGYGEYVFGVSGGAPYQPAAIEVRVYFSDGSERTIQSLTLPSTSTRTSFSLHTMAYSASNSAGFRVYARSVGSSPVNERDRKIFNIAVSILQIKR